MQRAPRVRDARAMRPIRRILVAVKNPTARVVPAVNKAAQIAKGLNAHLTLFHDIATPVYAEALPGRDFDMRSWQREIQTSRREQLDFVVSKRNPTIARPRGHLMVRDDRIELAPHRADEFDQFIERRAIRTHHVNDYITIELA
jgi:hypothetical protein